MKAVKVYALFLLIVLILLVLLAAMLSSINTNVSDDRMAMMEMWRSVSWFSIPSETAEHGEDAVIQWADPGMEAHIRFLLRRPEGEIRKSDVWDIQVLSIQPNYHTAHDTMLAALPEEWTAFDYSGVTGATRYWEYYEGKTFPPLQSLRDLVHFDSLQILCINLTAEENTLTDLSGLENRTNLKVLQLSNAAPDSLAVISELKALQYLSLDACGTLELQPLEELPELAVVSLVGSDIVSLEPLTKLPALSYLDIQLDTAYPTLEPLTRTTVKYLSMGLDESGDTPVRGIDYSVIARIPGLVGLSVSSHGGVDIDICKQILDGCGELRYLDIYGTPAAGRASELDTGHLAAFVYS